MAGLRLNPRVGQPPALRYSVAAGHPGVVKYQPAARAGEGGGIRDMAGKLARRDAGQTAIRVIQQRDTGRPEFSSCLAQPGLARAMQIGLRLIQRGCPAMGAAHDMHGSASRRELIDYRAQPEALIVRMGDHHQRARPGRQQRPGPGSPPTSKLS